MTYDVQKIDHICKQLSFAILTFVKVEEIPFGNWKNHCKFVYSKLIIHNQSHANCYLVCHRSSKVSHHSIAHESEGIFRGFWALGINTQLKANGAKI